MAPPPRPPPGVVVVADAGSSSATSQASEPSICVSIGLDAVTLTPTTTTSQAGTPCSRSSWRERSSTSGSEPSHGVPPARTPANQ